MKSLFQIFSTFTLAACLLFNACIFAEIVDPNIPKDVLVLKLPNNEATQWKAILRLVSPPKGLIEYIPTQETTENWKNLIAIQYFDKEINIKNGQTESLDEFLNRLEHATINNYPGCKVTFKVLEKNQYDAIYEWILHSQYNEIPPQRELSRMFSHGNKFYRIGYTHINENINDDDRLNWLKLFSESVAFISLDDPNFPLEDLSLTKRLSDVVDFEPYFNNWETINNWELENNVHSYTIVPPHHNKNYVTECLEILSMSRGLNSPASTIDQVLQTEKNIIKQKIGKEPTIQILEKTTREIVFIYQYPHEKLTVTEIARVRVMPFAYFSLHYKKGLPKPLSKEEIIIVKKHLESFKYKQNRLIN